MNDPSRGQDNRWRRSQVNVAPPRPKDFFRRASFRSFIDLRHPYDFLETYEVLKTVFGYETNYVNLGYWADGPRTVEPGRQLAMRLADGLRLSRDRKLVEVGSGLGQAAADLVDRYSLGEVLCINVNERQVDFANALAKSHGLGGKVSHVAGDAVEHLSTAAKASADAVLAVECVGHFRDPGLFLRQAKRVLRPGCRLGFCLNVSSSRLSLPVSLAFRLGFGFLPVGLKEWETRLSEAGFGCIVTEDWTEMVLLQGLSICRERLLRGQKMENRLVARYVMAQLEFALRSAATGKLSYHAIWASA